MFNVQRSMQWRASRRAPPVNDMSTRNNDRIELSIYFRSLVESTFICVEM